VSTNMLVGHTFRATVDGNNTVPETDETNNRNEYNYVLERGTC
jgi:subtilase family serine protease